MTKTIKLTLKPVSVQWIDASSHNDKHTQQEIDQLKPIIFHSCGFIVRQDEKLTILAQSYIKHQLKYEHLLVIPTSLIIS